MLKRTTMLLAVCLLSSCLAAPLMSGNAAFEGDYEDQHPMLAGSSDSINFDSELAMSDSQMTQLPAPVTLSLRRTAGHPERHEIALLSHTVPIAGAPQRVTSNVVPAIHDGRDGMQPGADEVLDDDCDSPQLGDIEPNPQTATTVNMNELNKNSTAAIPEQDAATREVLIDSERFTPVAADAPAAFAAAPAAENEPLKAEPVDSKVERSMLPTPNTEELKKSKCSRSTNGNDVPDPLSELGEDCGMPEPVIPCETRGNSTKCEPSLMLVAPPVPLAERMPPIMPSPQPAESLIGELSIELPDFGIARTVTVHRMDNIETVVVRALREFELLPWHIQMMRNFGAEVPPSRQIFQLEDQKQLVVYLRCVKQKYLDQLIVRLPACEDLEVKTMQVRVEVPETDDVFITEALSIDSVSTVLSRTPIPSTSISKVTYNGMRVQFTHTLEYIHFANKSALVVYLIAIPAPQLHVVPAEASSTLTGQSVEGSPSNSPSLPSSGASHDLPLVPIPQTDDVVPRGPMQTSAVVTLRMSDANYLDFPVLVTPDDVGLAIYEALHMRTGRPFKAFNVFFSGVKIEQATPLRPIGLITGDQVAIQMLPPQ